MKQEYIRIGTFDLDEVLDNIGPHNKEYLGKKIKMGSQRYELFKAKGVTCVKCGLKGEYFALEKHKKSKFLLDTDKYHFNLYGYNEKGEEVMLTKDHIIPRSKGGDNELHNYQTMCSICNWAKGNNDESE